MEIGGDQDSARSVAWEDIHESRCVPACRSLLTWNGRVVCHAELQSRDSGASNYKVVSNPGARDTSSVRVLVDESSRHILVGLGRTRRI